MTSKQDAPQIGLGKVLLAIPPHDVAGLGSCKTIVIHGDGSGERSEGHSVRDRVPS